MKLANEMKLGVYLIQINRNAPRFNEQKLV